MELTNTTRRDEATNATEGSADVQKKTHLDSALTLPNRPTEMIVSAPQAAEAISERLIRTERECRVAIAQISTDPGDIPGNTRKIVEYIAEAKRRSAQLVVFPELAIPGYCAMDLLWNRDYLAQNLAALQEIRKATQGITAIVGFADVDPTRTRPGNRPVLYNSAAIIHDGKIVGVQDKTLLPNYDIFFEDRYFAPPREQKVVAAGNLRIGTEICEDLWSEGYATNPTKELVDKGANIIVNLSASPFNIGKLPVRVDLVQQATQDYKVPFLYANLVGSFDGFEGEVVFDGRSIIMDSQGALKAVGSSFKEDLVVVDITHPTELELPNIEAIAELHDALVLGITDYFRRIGNGKKANFKHAYIGLSGGIDSAVVAALAVEALGADKVVGITMPSRFNSTETISDAERLAANLSIPCKKVPIERELSATMETLQADPEVGSLPVGVAEENLQARIRMLNLMYYANKTHGLVLNTGNKTELALDNCTIYGDMVGGFSVLGDVDKDRVFDLARYINRLKGYEVIPLSTIERVPTAELRENQIDATVMGADPAIIAPLVREIVEGGLTYPDAVARFTGQFPPDLILRTFQKLDRSEWKRRQAAPAIRVTPHSFGIGRRVPMSHGFFNK